ncbi:MAG TPA: ABC transporter permease, partial [Myxococcales bacterium]|nr:ABC transporter permease [Myxococcales bacterium]
MNPVSRFFTRIGAMAAKETLHIRRDPRTLYLALVMPVVLLLVFGYGVSFDTDHLPIAVVDLDQSSESRELVRGFTASGELEVAARPANAEEAERLA